MKTRTPLRKFIYTVNGAYLTAVVERRPRRGVPRVDTIRLKMHKPALPGHSLSIYMRPDEAIAIASCLAAAAWTAQSKRRRTR